MHNVKKDEHQHVKGRRNISMRASQHYLWALAALMTGVLFYLVERPAIDIYLLPDALAALQTTSPGLYGSIPSLLHAFGFCMLSAAVLGLSTNIDGQLCLSWWCIDSMLEISQQESIGPLLASKMPVEFTQWPILEALPGYLLAGTFDLQDIGCAALGCLCAYLLMKKLRRKHGA
jgi:hypothetical protein